MIQLRSASELPERLQEVLASGREKTTGLMCPQCQGGQSREHSLGAYRIGNEFVLKCYRLKCKYSAKLLLGGDAPAITSSFEARPYREGLRLLSDDALAFLLRKYRLRADTLAKFRVSEVDGMKAIYMPVYGPLSNPRGGMERRFDGWGEKADAYKIANEPWLAWYRKSGARGTVIVEDQLSAMRAWQLGYDGAALLGTEFSMEKAGEIVRYSVAPRIVALDADAFALACSIAKRHSWIDKVALLHYDLKDITDEEIEERLCG